MYTLRQFIHGILLTRRHITNRLEVKEIEVIKQFLQPPDVCLDIGAHGGAWSRPLAKIVSKGRVYSFEALPYYASVLNITFKLLRLKNVKIINKAVTDKNGHISIVWKGEDGKRLTGKTHIRSASEQSENTISVETVRLDTFFDKKYSEKIRFIKIDVEGAELFVIKGALNLIKNHRPVVYSELDTRWTSRYNYTVADVFNLFETLEYHSFIIDKNNSTLIPTAINTYRGKGDVLFIPNEKNRV
jgi:FkbM family methyltransferase